VAPSSRSLSFPRYVWEDKNYVRKAIHDRTTAAGGRLASHPLVYVGGDNKGPTELLTLVPRFSGSYKRNSDGSYPLPGVWETIGPIGTTEKVYGNLVPKLRSDSALSWYDLIDDDYIVQYRATDMTLLPDWERVHDLVSQREDARRQWSWLFLPIYFGFPVQSSIGAGVLPHFDVGNIPPPSPPYQVSWNRVAASGRHAQFELHVLRTPVSPTSPWSIVRNGWGVLNLPIAVWGLMPGYNVALIQLMPWTAGAMHTLGAPPARTYTSGHLPHRFTSEGQGIFREFGGHGFADLLEPPDSTVITGAQRNPEFGPRFWFNLHLGEHFSLENTYSWTTSAISYVAVHPNGSKTLVSGSLDMRQLTGGARYDLLRLMHSEQTQLYARAGYGWLWYRARDQRIDGLSSLQLPVERGHLPPLLPSLEWFPNLWFGGLGAEAFSPRRYWLFGLLGYGIRAEYSEYFHKLSPESRGREGFTTRRRDIATALIFGW
jgi:hypothetical protein